MESLTSLKTGQWAVMVRKGALHPAVEEVHQMNTVAAM